MSLRRIERRPLSHDAEIVDAIAADLRERLLAWCLEGGGCYDSKSADDVKAAIRYEDGAWRIVETLDSFGWMTDDALVVIFSDVGSMRQRALEDAEFKWVKRNSIVAKHVPGDGIKYHHYGLNRRGTVTEVKPTGKYVVVPLDEPSVKTCVNFESVDE